MNIKRNIVLSICIPTFNRSHRIYEAIQSIITCNSRDLEILVSDNASTDDTNKIVCDIDDDRISYHRNEENIGLVKNIFKSVSIAKGEYCLLISDEDRLRVEYLPGIMETLAQEQPVLAFTGVYSETKKSVYRSYSGGLIVSSIDTAYTYSFVHTYMSGIIIKKNPDNLHTIKNLSQHPDCIYPHELMIIANLEHGAVQEFSEILIDQGIQEDFQEFAHTVRPRYNSMSDRLVQTKFHLLAVESLVNNDSMKKAINRKLKDLALLKYPKNGIANGDSLLIAINYFFKLKRVFINISVFELIEYVKGVVVAIILKSRKNK